jgi:isopenicillin N synthase-like dioxygenase
MSSSSSPAVPIVDFAPFLTGDEAEKVKVVEELDGAFRNVGFVYLRNHGVNAGRVEECFRWVRYSYIVTFSHYSRLMSLHFDLNLS